MQEMKFYNFQDILKFLHFDWEFGKEKPTYPFHLGADKVEFCWGQVLIPKYGIREMVQNKVSDINEKPLQGLKMMYQVPFIVNGRTGIINQNLSLSFRPDKAWKYGDVTKSIYECCFWILEHAEETLDFFIIKDEVQEFFSYCVIDNQWGLGCLDVCSTPSEQYKGDISQTVRKSDDNIKHGFWHLLDKCANAGVYCSVCNKKVYKEYYANVKEKSRFCPNCGAMMDEKNTNVKE